MIPPATAAQHGTVASKMEGVSSGGNDGRGGFDGEGGQMSIDKDTVLRAVRILIGEDDVQLERTSAHDDGQGQKTSAGQRRLIQRLRRAIDACAALNTEDDGLDAVETSQLQAITGATALRLLVLLHKTYQRAMPSSSMPSSTSLQDDPALAQPIRQLVDIALGWTVRPALARFDVAHSRTHVRLQDQGTTRQRFTELDDTRSTSTEQPSIEAQDQEVQAYDDLDRISRYIRSIMPAVDATRLDIDSQTARILLERGASEVIDVELRLCRAPSTERKVQAQEASTHLGLVLRTLSPKSAISSLASSGKFRSKLQEAAQLGQHTSSIVPTPAYVRRLCEWMTTLQLLRPQGVQGLLQSSMDDSDARPELAQKLASYRNMSAMATILTTAPAGMPAHVYSKAVMDQLLSFIQANAASAGSSVSPQLTAAVLALDRQRQQHAALLREALQERLYRDLGRVTAGNFDLVPGTVLVSAGQVRTAVKFLDSIVQHSAPDPDFLTFILAPILGLCLGLLDHLNSPVSISSPGSRAGKGKIRVIGDSVEDPIVVKKELSEAMQRCLGAWARLSTTEQILSRIGTRTGSVLDLLSRGHLSALDGESSARQGVALRWADDEKGVCLQAYDASESVLSSLLDRLPETMRANLTLSGRDADYKALQGLPTSWPIQPSTIVKVLKQANRLDAAKLLLRELLDRYVATSSAGDMRLEATQTSLSALQPVLYLQVIVQLFETFGEQLLKDDIKSILAFIDYTITGSEASHNDAKGQGSQGLDGLLNVPRNEQGQGSTLDSDHEELDSEAVTTALGLLLALMEGDAALSARTVPMLGVIQAKLTPLLNASDEEVRRLSQEASLVLKAREHADQANVGPRGDETKATPRSRGTAKYQEALKLLQDPILPVRAHGLVILRELVSEREPAPNSKSSTKSRERSSFPIVEIDAATTSDTANKNEEDKDVEVDPALLPAILDIFVQAIQDEESYLYLNAVQGLAAMAINGGERVLKTLVSKYVGLDDSGHKPRVGRHAGQADVDRRLRIGEALLRVVQRCGARLGPNVSIIVGPLLTLLGDANSPTAIRSSAISLLGTCVEAAPLAMAAGGFGSALVTICLDLLSLESVERSVPLSAIKRRRKAERVARTGVKVVAKAASDSKEVDSDSDEEGDELQADSAVSMDAKLPQLRRSALFLLSLLVSGTSTMLDQHLGKMSSSLQRPPQLGSIRLPSGTFLPPLKDEKDTSVDHEGDGSPGTSRLGPLLINIEQLPRARRVLSFVGERDADNVVRVQASEALGLVGELELVLAQAVAAAR